VRLSFFAGVTLLTDAISGNGALSVLSLKKNDLCNREAGEALSDMLAVNTVLKELDVSSSGEGMLPSNKDGSGFAKELAVGIKDNGAMTSLHVGMNSIPEKEMKEIITVAMRKDSMKILCEVPIKDKTLTMLDISGKNLGMEGAVVVAEGR
jgi:hypothetical protein